ncbi:glutamine synthetase [Rhodobacteraceae bacterium CCMM004]|nr:glutamine synthetase [Rhodobacteraceae bacterium CCMM004]
MAGISDTAGMLRGKGFPLADLDKRRRNGVGWTPTNVAITCFDGIAPSPFGSLGDVVLWPDPERLAEVPLVHAPPLRLSLGEVRHDDGTPWACCLRGHLRRALEDFHAATGLTIRASFEHEFQLVGHNGGPAFSVEGFHGAQAFGEALVAALVAAGCVPDSFLREFGPGQFEVTLAPKAALEAADDAILLRAIVRAVARDHELTATFAPILDAGSVGNGVHIHLSFWDGDRPATHDPDGPAELAAVPGAALAGILRHMPALTALTAPSAVSFVRLTPHRWSAAFANLAVRDREAGLRVCPTTARDAAGRARQFNVEYRAADAAASPWLALSGLVLAALGGVRDGLATPHPTEGDLSEWSDDALAARGIARLPGSLDAALDLLEADAGLAAAYPDGFLPVYLAHKRFEIGETAELDDPARMARYAAVY